MERMSDHWLNWSYVNSRLRSRTNARIINWSQNEDPRQLIVTSTLIFMRRISDRRDRSLRSWVLRVVLASSSTTRKLQNDPKFDDDAIFLELRSHKEWYLSSNDTWSNSLDATSRPSVRRKVLHETDIAKEVQGSISSTYVTQYRIQAPSHTRPATIKQFSKKILATRYKSFLK